MVMGFTAEQLLGFGGYSGHLIDALPGFGSGLGGDIDEDLGGVMAIYGYSVNKYRFVRVNVRCYDPTRSA